MKLSNKHLFTGKSKGFTLVELLVVISIIATLGALSYGPIMKQIENSQVLKATKVCNDLVAAIDNFQIDYGYLPYEGAAYVPTDALIETDATAGIDFLNVLIGNNININDRGISYFDADQADGVTDGLVLNQAGNILSLVDKWGNPYSILLDYDQNGMISLAPLTIEEDAGRYDADRQTTSAVVLSPGRDGLFDDIKDSTSF